MQHDDNDSDQIVREGVARVVFASAPERRSEIQRLWADRINTFNLVDDRPGSTLDAGPFGIVRFSHRTITSSALNRPRDCWRLLSLRGLKYATLEWVALFNTQRLLEPLGYLPPAEFEEAFYRRHETQPELATLT
jgi:hypothetical protein